MSKFRVPPGKRLFMFRFLFMFELLECMRTPGRATAEFPL